METVMGISVEYSETLPFRCFSFWWRKAFSRQETG
jgi:hypothetical protein